MTNFSTSSAAAFLLSYDLSVIDLMMPAEIGPYCPSDILKILNAIFKKITPQANECFKIDKLAAELLTKLKERQDKTRKENSIEKSLQKKRLVFGAHETLKSVQRGNARLVFYAKNLDENNVRAASNFHSLQKLCPLENIPLIEVLTRREMSRIANKYPYVGVIGVLDVSLVESIANEIVTEWRSSDSYKLYHIDQSSLLP